jgi:hypothetical protein
MYAHAVIAWCKAWVCSSLLAGIWVRVQLGHGYVSLVNIVCLSGTGLCVRPISRPERPTDCDVSNSVIAKPQNRVSSPQKTH